MTPVLELPLRQMLLAINPIDADEPGGPRLTWERYSDRSWSVELRIFGHHIGLYC